MTVATHFLVNGSRVDVFRTRPINVYAPLVKHSSVERLDGGMSLSVAAHLDESEAPGNFSIPIMDEVYTQHLTKCFEEGSQRLF